MGQVLSGIVRCILFPFYSMVPKSILPREEEDVEKRVVTKETLMKQHSNLHSKVPNSILPREEEEDVEKRVAIEERLMKQCSNLHSKVPNSILPREEDAKKRVVIREDVKKRVVIKQLQMKHYSNLHKILLVGEDFGCRFWFRNQHDRYFSRFHRLHKNVVMGFLNSACKMLRANGEVHVTHKTAHPFNKWEIEKLAEDVGLRLVEKSRFSKRDYPDYDNKRGDGQTFPVGECCTFKFAKTPILSFY